MNQTKSEPLECDFSIGMVVYVCTQIRSVVLAVPSRRIRKSRQKILRTVEDEEAKTDTTLVTKIRPLAVFALCPFWPSTKSIPTIGSRTNCSFHQNEIAVIHIPSCGLVDDMDVVVCHMFLDNVWI